MRLTPLQRDVFKRLSREVFGLEAHLLLFGSRIDEQRRGGDRDLYVTGFDRPAKEQLEARLRFPVLEDIYRRISNWALRFKG